MSEDTDALRAKAEGIVTSRLASLPVVDRPWDCARNFLRGAGRLDEVVRGASDRVVQALVNGRRFDEGFVPPAEVVDNILHETLSSAGLAFVQTDAVSGSTKLRPLK